jgi:tetratricopeptide (TPR) repeat protein
MRPIGKVYVYLILVAAVLIPYAQVSKLGFTNFDDPEYVTQNSHVRAGLTWAGLTWAFKSTEQANWHPITWLSHMLDCQLYGLNPAGHHITNLILHLASTLLLFGILQHMTGAVGRSAFVAALFALHPLHVESVAWVAERKDVLSALFWMLAMCAYLGYHKMRRPVDGLAVLLCLVLGLASKPMLVTLPFALLLLDFWPLRRFAAESLQAGLMKKTGQPSSPHASFSVKHAAISEKIPLMFLATASSIMTYAAQQKGGAVIDLKRLSLDTRIANALVSYVSYVRKTLWPVKLAPFYPLTDSIALWQVAASVVVLGSITFLAIRWLQSRPYFAIGWLWYLGTLVPVIGLVQVGNQALADRYTYIPLVGLFIIAAWGGWDLAQYFRIPRLVTGVVAFAFVLLFGIMTAIQIRYWKNSEVLFRRTIEVTGDNQRAYLNLGAALASENRFDEAVSVYKDILGRKPEDAELQARLAMMLAILGRNQESIQHYRHALQIDPHHPEALNGLGFALGLAGQLEEAAALHLEALRWKPEFPEARYNLGKIYAAQGKPQLAVNQFTEALRQRPEYFEAHEKLALVLSGRGRFDEALPHFAFVTQARPEDAELRYRFGMALYLRKKTPEAIGQLREAVRLKPDWTEPIGNLAWILATRAGATAEDAAQALAYAERLVALQPKSDAATYDTLAAAYALAGRFADAIKSADEALRLAQVSGDKSRASEIERRCRLYRSGQRYQEEPR